MDSEHQGTRHPAGHFISFLENLYGVNFSSIPTLQTRMAQTVADLEVFLTHYYLSQATQPVVDYYIDNTYSLLFHTSSLERASSLLDFPISTRCLEVKQETMQMEIFLPFTTLWTDPEVGAMQPTYKSSSTISLPSLFLCLAP